LLGYELKYVFDEEYFEEIRKKNKQNNLASQYPKNDQKSQNILDF